jgi:general secretion pathway protein G
MVEATVDVKGVTYNRTAKVGLLIVAGVCAVFISVQRFGIEVEYSQHVKISADIQEMKKRLTLYERANGFYPRTEQGLQALVTRPDSSPTPMRWHQLYKVVPKDPWQNNYIYICPGIKNPDDGYDLYSAGPSRKPGAGTDDWGD